MNALESAKTTSAKAGMFYSDILPIFTKHSLSRSIYVVAKLKIAELLQEGPMDATAISARLDCKEELLLRILNYVATKGIFKRDAEGRFENTELSLQLRRAIFGDQIIADQDRNWKKLGNVSEEFTQAISSQVGDGGTLWSFARGYILSRAIFAAAVLGIDSLSQKAPYHALFEQAGLVLGHRLTPQGELLLDAGCREFFIHEIEERWHALGELEMAVKTGKIPFVELYGKTFFEYLNAHPEKTANFDKSMTFITECELEAIKPNIQKHFAPGMTVADIGGGHGKFLSGLLDGHPEVLGILFDLEQTVKKHEIPAALQDRVIAWPGDFFKSVPAADIYVIKRVLHDWGDQECIEILKRCREGMKPGAKLLINEFALPNPISAAIDINMITIFNGRQRTVEEFKDLCRKAGWNVIETAPSDCGIITFVAV